MSDLHLDGLEVLYNVIALVLQSLFYGIHLLLVPFALHMLLKRDSKTRPNIYILFAILAPFLLSSVFWVLRFANVLVQIRIFFLDPSEQFTRNFTYYITLFNAIFLLNYIISDAVVVWRACVLCKDDFKKSLLVPKFFLVLTILSILATIGLRITSYFTVAGPNAASTVPVIKAIDYFQVADLVMSFMTNLAATFVVGLKVWRFRRAIKEGLLDMPNKSTRVERILTLLIESGLLYCIAGAVGLLFSVVKIPLRSLGDIYTPMNLELAGIYPTIVIVLVSMQQSSDITTQWQGPRSTGPATVMASQIVSGQIQFARSASLDLDSTSDMQSDDLVSNLKPGMQHDAKHPTWNVEV